MLKICVNFFYRPVEQLKQYLYQNKDIYVPVNGGSLLKDDDWCRENAFFDDSCADNISIRNKALNENTSIYWMWKNLDKFEGITHVGFNHYRRFFPRYELVDYEKYDIIVANPIKCPYSLEWQYGYYHDADDLRICEDVLRRFDSAFASGFSEYMKTEHDNFAPMNMFVMREQLFREWCGFVFPVLFELENRIDVSGRDNYQKRAVCFLEERILGYWCSLKKKKENLDVKQSYVYERLDWKDNRLNERGTYD